MSILSIALTGPEAEARSVAPPMETDEALYELVHGVRIAIPAMSYYANKVTGRLSTNLAGHVERNGLGTVVTETLFLVPLADDRERLRRPDVAFVSRERWPVDRPDDPDANGWAVVPDLAVEVVSPTDRADDLMSRTLEFFQAGVRQVWLVYPRQAVIHVYDGPKSVRVFDSDEVLEGGVILPGLSLNVSSIFPPVIA